MPAAGLLHPATPSVAPATATTPVANKLLFVNYSLAAAASLAQAEPLHFPYVVLPPRTGGVVKLPQMGRAGRRGHTEAAFLTHLRQHFGAAFGLHDNRRLLVPGAAQFYEPDFTLHDETSGLNLLLDVEIDEPYAGTNDPTIRQLLHYQGADTNRNNAFRNRGWVVVRFAEIQVHQHPEACCRFLTEVVARLNPAFVLPPGLLTVLPLPPVPQWTQAQAQAWSSSRYREGYLGLGPNGFSETAAEPWIAAVEEDVRGQQSEALVRDEPPVRIAVPVASTVLLVKQAEIPIKPAANRRRIQGSFTRPIPNPQIPCPVCRLGIMLRGKAAYGCSRFRDGCQFRVPFVWGGRSLSDKDLMILMHNGETAVLGGFTNSKGKKYDAALKVYEDRVVPVFG